MEKVVIAIIGLLFVSSFLILVCDVIDFVVKWRRKDDVSKLSDTDIIGRSSRFRSVRYDDVYKLDYNKYFMYLRQSLRDAYRKGL